MERWLSKGISQSHSTGDDCFERINNMLARIGINLAQPALSDSITTSCLKLSCECFQK